MTAFRDLKPQRPQPADHAEVLPGHFADTWPQKPMVPVRVGLRTVSEADFQIARAEASRKAWESYPDGGAHDERVDCFNDNLAAWVVARGTTQADDASRPWIDMAQDNLQLALTPAGIRFLFERLIALMTERSPLSPEIAPDEIERLSAALRSSSAITGAARRARRLAKRALDLLTIG